MLVLKPVVERSTSLLHRWQAKTGGVPSVRGGDVDVEGPIARPRPVLTKGTTWALLAVGQLEEVRLSSSTGSVAECGRGDTIDEAGKIC